MTISQALELAVQHHQAGRLAEAEALYRQILAVMPNHTDALHNLGVIALQCGHAENAVGLIRQAIALSPLTGDMHHNLAEALRALGRIAEACVSFQRAAELRPNFADTHFKLGVTLHLLGRTPEAAAAFRRATELNPDFADAQFDLGVTLHALGDADGAFGRFDRALAIKPALADAHCDFCVSVFMKGRMDEAIASIRWLIERQPDNAKAHNLLGQTLKYKGRLDEAAACCRRAIAINPAFTDAYCDLGVILRGQGDLKEAEELFRKAIVTEPARHELYANLLLTLHCSPDATPESVAEEHREWARIHAEPLCKNIRPHENDSEPGRRLRVGYVSADLHEHAVAYFLEPLLENHSSAAVEIFCYTAPTLTDATTERLRGLVNHWRDITGMTDEKVADLIREDRVDILVDLAGHTPHGRPLVFARKPAPVQVTWLGYPATTGLKTIDFRITDAFADPPGMTEHLHSERLFDLPGCAWCWRVPDGSPETGEPPSLAAGHITFGCYCANGKINAPLIALWARVLLAVPGSRMLLKNLSLADAASRSRILTEFERHGVSAGRIDLLEYSSNRAEHLAAYHRMDIALDTFPYHGTATTCDALWMGVPVVSLGGKCHASRVGVSLLNNVGRAKWIAGTEDEFVAIAAGLAGDVKNLTETRAALRGQMQASPLMDAKRFARNIEAAYRSMWRKWCGQQDAGRP